MSKGSSESERLDRMRRTCSVLDELREDTYRLFESIEAQSFRTLAAATKARKLKATSLRPKR